MNLGELKTAVKRFGFDDSDPLASWINAAVHDFEKASDWPFLEALSEIAIAVGATTFAVPADFSKAVYLRDKTNKDPLEYWDIRRFEREIDDPASTGKPSVFTLVGMETAILWPVADTAATLRLLYMKDLGDMVGDADTPGNGLIPTKHHWTIVQRAVAIALQAENEEERAQTAMAEYATSLNADISLYDMRYLGEPDQVQDTQAYAS